MYVCIYIYIIIIIITSIILYSNIITSINKTLKQITIDDKLKNETKKISIYKYIYGLVSWLYKA